MKDFDFENSLKELEQTVSALEKGDMPLDESIKAFEKGIALSKECSKYLENAKQKIISLSEAEDGENND
ncbi:MAG TPA: exodeoxyribonuclease VII small subunit [Ruminococcaceae bacterium]|nr:exodeoxyribonuclease VII small subunit [Oscillospiraceae bacterium]